VWLDVPTTVYEDLSFGGGYTDPNFEVHFQFEEDSGGLIDYKGGYTANAYYNTPIPPYEGVYYSQTGKYGDSINCHGSLGGWFELQDSNTLFNKLRNGFTASVWLYGDETELRDDGMLIAGGFVFGASTEEDVGPNDTTAWWTFNEVQLNLSPDHAGALSNTGSINSNVLESIGTGNQRLVTKDDYVGRWNHWAMVFDPANDFHGVYVNGLMIDRNMDPRKQVAWPKDSVTACTICGKTTGAWPDRRWPWNGRIDDLRFYSRPLTHGEILNLAGVSEVLQPVLHGDINNDDSVDLGDLAELADIWGDDPCENFWPGAEYEGPAPPPPPPPPNEVEVSFNVSEDSYVKQSAPTGNYGGDATMKVRGPGANIMNAFLKFNVSGIGTVADAKLKVYTEVQGETAPNDIVDVSAVADTTWTEMDITYANQPPIGAVLDSNSTPDDEWAEWDVTSHITGDGTYSLAMTKTANVGQQQQSRENTYIPVLVITHYPLVEHIDSFDVSEDSYVKQSAPTGNYGGDSTMKVRGPGTNIMSAFLKFNVADLGTVTSAKLKLYTSVQGSVDPNDIVDARAVADTTWTEMTITDANQPAIGAILDSNSTPESEWAEWDVTSHITGDGTYSLAHLKVN
jgi:hypothetical protein